MHLHSEDPRLTAYLLGELPAEEAAAVECAVAADPVLQDALRELETARCFLTESLPSETSTLSAVQRDAILHAARSGNIAPLNIRRNPRKRWLPVLAAAAALALVAAVFPWKKSPKNQRAETPAPTLETSTLRPEPKALPAPGPVDDGALTAIPSSAVDSDFPALRARGHIAAAGSPTLELPLQSGSSSLDWIRQSILTERKLPDPHAVRFEEILNRFQIRPAGITVVARQPATQWHPDNRSDGATSHAATISAETLACPWKPSSSLVLISIRGNPMTDCELKAVFHADTTNVRRYRLLGFSPVAGSEPAPLPTLLPAKSAISLVIEIEPSTVAGDLGAIEWSANGRNAAPVPLARHGDAEPSNDARFAALVCTYAQWLARDSGGTIDTDLLAALAREIAADDLPADRMDFLTLIDRSLGL